MKQVLGYFLGFAVFIVGIPALMWWVAGKPSPTDIPVTRFYLALPISLVGLALSIWSIIYMERVGTAGFCRVRNRDDASGAFGREAAGGRFRAGVSGL